MTLGTLLAQRLRAAGVRRAYGFPGGGSNIELIACLEAEGIRWVLAHTEVSAALMACAEAELTGVPGVVIVGNGPGLASAVNGVAHAWLDRVPLVVISDRYTEAEVGTGHQVLDQLALLAPVVKLGETLEPARAAEQIDRALACALARPLGPVHFDMPRDAAGAAVTASRAPELRASGRLTVDAEPGGRVAMIAGLEAIRIDGLVPLAERLEAAVLTTYKAKGVFAETHPRWAGIFTNAELERPVLSAADRILAVGLDAVELLGRPWTYAAPVEGVFSSDAYLGVGPAQAWSGPGFSLAEIAAYRSAALDRVRVDAGGRSAWRVVETVMAALPPGVTLTVDAGAHMLPVTMFARPSGRFLISNGLATMGFAVPAAVAASLVRPGELVVAFTGDGGLAYNLAELETLARTGARVLVIVFNDASLSLIRIKQPTDRGAFDYRPTDFAAVAAAHGLRGVAVDGDAALRAALAEAVERPDSTLLDVRIDGREYGPTLKAIRG